MATKTVARKAPAAKVLTADVISVSPKLAASWLKGDPNRGLRPQLVDKYARDMSSGNWALTGEAIKFDTTGALADGQHRLHAVVQSGATVPMLVVRNVPQDAMTVMDSGAARTASDALTLGGHRYTALCAAAARLAVNWQRGQFAHAHQSSIMPVSHSEIIEWVESNPDIETMASLVSGGWRRIPCRGSVITFTSWACQRIDAPAAVQFFDDLAEMRTAGVGDPRQALLRRFQSAVEQREQVSSIQQSDALFRAWNAMRRGQRLTRINPRYKSDNFTDPR